MLTYNLCNLTLDDLQYIMLRTEFLKHDYCSTNLGNSTQYVY